MKKLILSFMTLLMLLAFAPSHLTAATVTGKATPTVSKAIDSPEALVIIARLQIIKAMDVSDMSSVQKRELRREVRSLNGTLRQMDGGIVYISAGGLLVVLLLVIILL